MRNILIKRLSHLALSHPKAQLESLLEVSREIEDELLKCDLHRPVLFGKAIGDSVQGNKVEEYDIAINLLHSKRYNKLLADSVEMDREKGEVRPLKSQTDITLESIVREVMEQFEDKTLYRYVTEGVVANFFTAQLKINDLNVNICFGGTNDYRRILTPRTGLSGFFSSRSSKEDSLETYMNAKFMADTATETVNAAALDIQTGQMAFDSRFSEDILTSAFRSRDSFEFSYKLAKDPKSNRVRKISL